MPVMDEFKEEREALKNAPLKKKISYFFYYYKWHVIAVIAVIFFMISLGYQMLTRKDTAFYAALVNAIELTSAEEYIGNFGEYAGIDLEKFDIVLDATMRINLEGIDPVTLSSSQKLMANIAAKNVDVMIADAAVMENHANNDTFLDLRDFLSEEQFSRYQSRLYYIDQAVVDEKNARYNDLDNTYVPQYPDPRKPETMQEPIPVGIYLHDASNLRNYYYYAQGDVIVGVVGNTERSETTSMFLDYILE